jgi:hypothetical protein
MLMIVFHHNYYFTIFEKHQTIDLVKKICKNRLSSGKRVHKAGFFFQNPHFASWTRSPELKRFLQIF